MKIYSAQDFLISYVYNLRFLKSVTTLFPVVNNIKVTFLLITKGFVSCNQNFAISNSQKIRSNLKYFENIYVGKLLKFNLGHPLKIFSIFKRE